MNENVVYIHGEDEHDCLLADNDVVVIDFYADWCGPCKMLAPVFEKMAGEYVGKVAFAKCNVDENESLAVKYDVSTIPTLIFFKGGEVQDRIVGLVMPNDILKKIDSYID